MSFKVCILLHIHLLLIPTHSKQFRDAIASTLKGGSQDSDLLHWTSRAALELIGQSMYQGNFPVYFVDVHRLRWPGYMFACASGDLVYSRRLRLQLR